MHVLLIAYEFPPSPSPQSLRWAYLSRHLAARGHRVTVLTIHLGGRAIGLPDIPPSIGVHRTYAGPVRGTLAALRDRKSRRQAPSRLDAAGGGEASRHSGHGWKQALSDGLQGLAAKVVFPDVRGEWFPWARRRLLSLLETDRPDVAISSHEPATTLELGLMARERGVPWIADLGDPVLASYTPARWRRRSFRLEQAVCRQADHIIVTTPTAAGLLADRHQRHERVSVLTQGFESATGFDGTAPSIDFDPGRLELLYTGSFYSFRRPDELLRALAAHPGVRLNVAAVTVPEELLEAARRLPSQVRLLGFLPHRRALQLQRGADVLVNIGNQDPAQVPGKIYEYLGSGRPILHLGTDDDAISRLIGQLKRGWNCENHAAAVSRWMEDTAQAKTDGSLDQGLDLTGDRIAEYSWERLASRLEAIAQSLLR
ncbi:glycosyltransferase [Pseudoxanthomonas putridarboris]|uniref:Glycosyltransferase n=1 Tax=Pseudoxanthomonas putridarboris TaxID=752605 RepID=A0ABU9J3P1_9GAMM